MNNFELISISPLTTLSDELSPTRKWAKEQVKSYRQKRPAYQQDAPPVGSLRRVYWAAKKEDRRGVIERVKSYFVGILERLIQ